MPKWNPLLHNHSPPPIKDQRKCWTKCGATIEMRFNEATQRNRPFCMEHSQDHFICCPHADRVKAAIRERERQKDQKIKESERKTWERNHPSLQTFDR